MFDELGYSVSGHWVAGERSSIVAAGAGAGKSIEFSAPVEFHGEPGFWTPEEFLLAAVASCFTTTFRAIAGNSKFEPLALDITVEGKLTKNPGGYDFTSIVIRPQVAIGDESERPRACRLLEKAERGCLVARALKCPVTMEASVQSPANAVECESVAAPVR